MAKYDNLLFFDKQGNPCNFTYDTTEEMWLGTMYLPRVSVNIFATESLYILEKFIDKNTLDICYGKPHVYDPTVTSTYDYLYTEWEEDNTEHIFLFEYDPTATNPYLTTIDSKNLSVDRDPNETIDTSTGIKVTDIITNDILTLDIALQSDEEEILRRYLLIKDGYDGSTIARIDIYGETEGEDVRLESMSHHLGYQFLTYDTTMFKESDVEEQMLDFSLLNRKRKEILLEGSNITPHIGAYKGLINSIKYFGYNDLKIREYWKNINPDSPHYGKYRSTGIIDIFDSTVDFSDPNILLPNRDYKKTNLFNLLYRMNEIVKGVYDDFGMPVVQETSQYTAEEAMIKLYGLQKILKEYFLPTNSRILDISAEADFFGKESLRCNVNFGKTDVIDVGVHPDFKVFPNSIGYIRDLRTINDLIWPEETPWNVPHDFRDIYSSTGYTIEDIKDVLVAYFTDYYPKLDSVSQLPDKEGIPAGYPIILMNESFSIDWEKIEGTWDELVSDKNYIFDIWVYSVSVGDTFIITDKVSESYISYTAIAGDTSSTVISNLYTQWQSLYSSQTLPWGRFLPKIEVSGTDTFLRAYSLCHVSSGLSIDFVGSTVQGSGLDDQDIVVYQISQSDMYTWSSVYRGNFYEMEWTIYKQRDDSPEFYHNVRGAIPLYENYPINLPYVGTYDVELKLYDTTNNLSSLTKHSYITVESKETDFMGFYKYRKLEYLWDSLYTWNQHGSYWDLPLEPNDDISYADISWYEALSRENALPNEGSDPNNWLKTYENSGNVSYVGPYYWNNMEAGDWDDCYHLWWDSTDVSGDTPANFKISNVYLGGQLIIETETATGVHTFSTYNLIDAANALNNSNDTIISKYTYNMVLDINDIPVYILASGKHFGKNYDFLSIIGTNNVVVYDKNNSITCNPTYNDISMLIQGKKLSRYTYLSFSYDKCEIPGKTHAGWVIRNNTTGTESNIYNKKWFNYLFKETGNYSISLVLEDSNGNKKTTEKNFVIQ